MIIASIRLLSFSNNEISDVVWPTTTEPLSLLLALLIIAKVPSVTTPESERLDSTASRLLSLRMIAIEILLILRVKLSAGGLLSLQLCTLATIKSCALTIKLLRLRSVRQTNLVSLYS